MTLARRRAVDHARALRAAADRERRAALGGYVPSYDPVTEAVLARGERQDVRAALRTLSPLEREAIELVYYRGHTGAEAARLLGLPLGTFKTRLRDGVQRLRATVAPPGQTRA